MEEERESHSSAIIRYFQVCSGTIIQSVFFFNVDPHDNSIEFEQKKLGLSPSEAKERKTSMKKDEKEIKEGYLRLEHLVSTHRGAEPSFKDNRVRTLWAKAKKTNWENDELNEFKVQSQLEGCSQEI